MTTNGTRRRGRLHGVPPEAAAVIGLIVVVISIGLLGPKRQADQPPAPSPRPAASGLPTVAPTAIGFPTAPPSAAPTLPPGAFFAGYPEWAYWSPSGAEIAVFATERGDDGVVNHFGEIFDLHGHQLDRIRADSLVWIDAGSYFAFVAPSEIDPTSGRGYVGHVGSPERTPLPAGCGTSALGANGRFVLLNPDLAVGSYCLWSGGRILGPFAGGVEAVSPDGGVVAVDRIPPDWTVTTEAATPRLTGTTMDLISTDTGATVASVSGALWPPSVNAAFSPDGRFLAYGAYDPKTPAGVRMGLFDLSTKRVWTAAAPANSQVTWTDSTHLVIRSDDPPNARLSGFPVKISYGTWFVQGSPTYLSSDGRLASWDPGTGDVVVSGPAKIEVLHFGGAVQWLAWSPQGSAMVVFWGTAMAPLADGDGFEQASQFVSLVFP